MTARAWRHPYQVVRVSYAGTQTPTCSHRYEVTAEWCAQVRDLFAGLNVRYYDVRPTPEVVR